MNDEILLKVWLRVAIYIPEDCLIDLTWLISDHTKNEQNSQHERGIRFLYGTIPMLSLVCDAKVLLRESLFSHLREHIEDSRDVWNYTMNLINQLSL